MATTRRCEICEQEGDSFQRVNPETKQIETIDNPLFWYPPAIALVCSDCRNECADDLVGAVNDAAMTRAAERTYRSGIDYACGYRN